MHTHNSNKPWGYKVHVRWDWNNVPWDKGLTVPVGHVQLVMNPQRTMREQYRVNYPDKSDGAEDDSDYEDSEEGNSDIE